MMATIPAEIRPLPLPPLIYGYIAPSTRGFQRPAFARGKLSSRESFYYEINTGDTHEADRRIFIFLGEVTTFFALDLTGFQAHYSFGVGVMALYDQEKMCAEYRRSSYRPI